jgi:hypothetical protein
LLNTAVLTYLPLESVLFEFVLFGWSLNFCFGEGLEIIFFVWVGVWSVRVVSMEIVGKKMKIVKGWTN